MAGREGAGVQASLLTARAPRPRRDDLTADTSAMARAAWETITRVLTHSLPEVLL